MDNFNAYVWPKILENVEDKRKTKKPICTIDKGNKNWVLEITPDSIIIQSERNQRGQDGGSSITVYKDAVQETWKILIENGIINRKMMVQKLGNKIWRTGAIIRGILACLPNVNAVKLGRKSYLIYKGQHRMYEN